MASSISRRDFALHAGILPAGAGVAGEALGSTNMETPAGMPGEITNNNVAIHQEVMFPVPPARVYETLTTATEFDKVVRLSAAMGSALNAKIGAMASQIDPVVGGGFSLFGGYITGRNLELVPDTRIVQAWHAGSWDEADYSIVRFVLTPSGSGTKLVFDHMGFPSAAAGHLAQGWHINYWDPMARVFAG